MVDIGFTRPTFSQLLARAQADIESRLPGADARLRRSVLSVLAHVTAGLAHGLHGALHTVARQALPDRADTEHLDRWGASYGIARRAASRAVGSVEFSGSEGSIVPAATVLRREDGAEFRTLASAMIAAGTATAPVEAVVAGLAGNTLPGLEVKLTLVQPVAGIGGQADVNEPGLSGGADREGDEDYRSRLLDRLREAPHGGSLNDYRRWAFEVPGVSEVFVAPGEAGPGTVTIRFVMDGITPDGLPGPGDVASVQAHFDAPDRRPVTAVVEVKAPVAKLLPIEVRNLSPSTAEVRAAVIAELADLIRRERRPGEPIFVSNIWEAISIASGERSHSLVAPTADVGHGPDEIAVLGPVTFI